MLVSMLVMLFSACAQSTLTPVPPAPTAVPVEEVEEEVKEEPTEVVPEPFTLVFWAESASLCCSKTIPEFIPRDIKGPGDMSRWVIDEFHKAYPQYDHVTIEVIIAQYGEDAEVELDTLIAAGEAPNILEGYAGRMGAYVEIAAPLEDLLSDEQRADFLPGRYEDLFFGGDHLLVMSTAGGMHYTLVNADLLRAAGAEVPEPWSIMSWDEYLTIGEKVKALDDGSYLGCVWGGNPTAWDWIWSLFAGAGVSMFEGGDLTQVTMGSPIAVELLTELIRLEQEGYLVPGTAGLSVFDCLEPFKEGKIAVWPGHLGNRSFILQAVEAGILEEPYETVPILAVQFDEEITPLLAGSNTGTAGIVTVFTPEEQRKAAFDFVFFDVSIPWCYECTQMVPGLYSQLERHTFPSEHEQPAIEHIIETGIAELGYMNPHYSEIRGLWVEEFGAAFLGLKSPAEALVAFTERANALIAE